MDAQEYHTRYVFPALEKAIGLKTEALQTLREVLETGDPNPSDLLAVRAVLDDITCALTISTCYASDEAKNAFTDLNNKRVAAIKEYRKALAVMQLLYDIDKELASPSIKAKSE